MSILELHLYGIIWYIFFCSYNPFTFNVIIYILEFKTTISFIFVPCIMYCLFFPFLPSGVVQRNFLMTPFFSFYWYENYILSIF